MVRAEDTRPAETAEIAKTIIRDNQGHRDTFTISANHGTGAAKPINRFQQTLDTLVETMEADMDEISKARYNGMPIKDDKQLRFRVEQAIQPVLRTMAKLSDINSVQGGWGNADIGTDHMNTVGTSTIDTNAAELQMREAVNTWMNSVVEQRLQDKVGLPVAANSDVRGFTGDAPDGGWTEINHGRDVVRQTQDGYEPRKMVTDSEAAAHMGAEQTHTASTDAAAQLGAIVQTHTHG